MQPISQLPTDAPASPAPKNLKKNALLLLVVVAIVAALVAWLLPQQQVEASKQPTDAYKAPTR